MDREKEFCERLRELFLLNGETVAHVAEKISLTGAAVYGYLSGCHLPNLESAIKLARYFECSLDYLFGFTDRKEAMCGVQKEEICLRLACAIAEEKSSKYRLAKEYELDEAQLYRWCHGLCKPSLANLAKLADILGCSLDYLAGY